MTLLDHLEPERAVRDLRELAAITSDAAGAQRLAWGDGWKKARDWFCGKLEELPCDVEVDAGGNILATVPGDSDRLVGMGSHLDSVPGGGWLDGALGVVAGLEVLRAHAKEPGAVGIRLFDWADEEGARFGASLLGSSAAAGTLDPASIESLEHDGESLRDALRRNGVELDRATDARASLRGLRCLIEMHIEQGPVLEHLGRAVAVVSGAPGVERHTVLFQGSGAAHVGAAPMSMRTDPVMAAARFIADARLAAVRRGATATAGSIEIDPNVWSIVPTACEVVIDHRHADAQTLTEVVAESRAAAEYAGAREGVEVTWSPQFQIAPVPFDPELIELATQACRDAGAEPLVIPSGALHDAVAIAPVVPSVMLFTSSRGGISHAPEEDTDPEHLEIGVRALAHLTMRAQAWAADGS